jgi:cell division septation protein DedD
LAGSRGGERASSPLIARAESPRPHTSPAPQTKSISTEPREALTLRIAVFTSEEDAKAQVASLAAQGLKPTIIQMPTSAGVMLHNVCVGQFETRSAANAAAKELQRRLGYLPVVIPAPPPSNL